MHRFHLLSGMVFTTIWGLDTALAQASFKVVQHATGTGSASDITLAAPENVMKLQQSKGAPSALYSKAIAHGNGEPDVVEGTYGTSELKAVELGLVYTTPITFGDEEFTVVIDTGSADTWLVENNFTCKMGAQSECDFGPTYTRSSTFTPINDQNFQISYADGRYLNGVFGKEKVTLAGITVKDAQVAIVEEASWSGDGSVSGVLGLAFPANTRAFTGTSYSADSINNQIAYNPLFTSMYVEGSVPQIFSLALDRDGTGQLAIGGTPDIDYVPTFASAPFQLLTTAGVALDDTHYTFYTITTDGFQYQSAQNNWNTGAWLTYFGNPNDPSKVQVLVDSGTTVNWLPYHIASAVNALFDPPATYNAQTGYYTVACDAKAPQFGVKIGLETFYINPLDMIVKYDGARCITGVTATGEGGTSILGHAFLKNVLAIFDVGASEMRFAAREYYD